MAQAGDEWELSKENVQPLRQGRVMSTLQEVLSQQDTAGSVIHQQKQAFELELRFYSGDDPLDVWDRYIKWAEQAFPQGGKESNMFPLLERAVKIFHEEKRYYDDFRYLGIFIKFARFCSEPLDVYSYLHSQGIGVSHALLYITWAEEYEAHGNFKKADAVFQDGIQRKVEPMDKLEVHHRQFQARVSRQVLQGISEGADAEEPEVFEPQRNSLVDLKCKGKNKARAPVSRTGEFTKSRSHGPSLQSVPPQQIPARSGLVIFDENSLAPVATVQQVLNPQPWAALPPSRAKENDQKAGPWNSGRSSRGAQQVPSTDVPGFTPYVDEAAVLQTVTPCKINPAVTSVLSSRKPGKEEDPLQRLQISSQEKEMHMYCKSKVYAGMEEFSLEEIRAEIYTAKLRKKREEDLQASYQRRMEMEQKIEEMEKMLKEASCEGEQKVIEQASVRAAGPALCSQEAVAQCDTEGARCLSPDSYNSEVPEAEYNVPAHKLPRKDELGRAAPVTLQEVKHKQDVSESWSAPSSSVPFTIFESCDAHPSSASVLSAQSIHQTNPMCADAASSSNVPFTIFDESCELQPHKLPKDLMPPPVRRPLATSRPKAWSTQEHSLMKDELDGVETLKEDAIVWGCQNKSLIPEPEDTSEFARAAQLASTPFHDRREVSGQSAQSNTSDMERLPLREKTPVCEESYRQEQCVKKLSPILEASQEDGRSSVSSVSSVSSASNSTSTFQSKTLPAADHFNTLAQITGVCELSVFVPEDPFPAVELTELHRQLLEPMYELWASPEMQHEAEQLPVMKDQTSVTLGGVIFSLTREIPLGGNTKLYVGVQVDHSVEGIKEEVAIKVEFQPVPWDFYISSQLKERLEDCFQTHFLQESNCYLFKDGCIMLYKNINSFSVEDSKEFINEVIVLIAYNLLDLVTKLHSAQIVHGDLRLDTLRLDDRIFNLPSCFEMSGLFKLIDFSSSMDLQLCPTMTSRGFPVAQTKHGQQFLAHRTSPYQVDLFGIADVVHLMIFRKHLELHHEESGWKIHEEIPNTFSYKMFDTFFAKILNTDDESTASVLQDLTEEMRALFDGQFQKKISDYVFKLVMQLYV